MVGLGYVPSIAGKAKTDKFEWARTLIPPDLGMGLFLHKDAAWQLKCPM